MPEMKIDVRGIEAIEQKLNELPHGTKRIAVQAATDYLIGDEAHGLKHYPPYMGQKYKRTYNLQRNWTRQGTEYQTKIVNYAPYASYVPRWKKYGWREWAAVVDANLKGAMRHVDALVKAYIKGIGL